MKFNKWYNGIGKSKYDQNGFHSLIGIDIHDTIGLAKSEFALKDDDKGTVTEHVRAVVTLPNESTLWFSVSSGKIWKRTSGGTWSLVHTNTNGGCGGAILFNDYVFYGSGNDLGRYNISTDTWTDSWATFSSTNSQHPMVVQNLSLFIGAGVYVAKVDDSYTFTAQALDIPDGEIIYALEQYETDIIIGTTVDDSTSQCGVFRWDTYSDSWLVEDYLIENGIHSFIKSDNRTFINAGKVGNIYEYDGVKAYKSFTLRDESGHTTENYVATFQSGADTLNGKLYIGTKRGVFGYNRYDASINDAMSVDFVTTGGRTASVTAIIAAGDNLLVAWNKTSSYGVDSIDTANRTDGVIYTPVAEGQFKNVIVKYDELPTGTSIAIDTKADDNDWVAQTPVVDTINKRVYFNGGLGKTNALQARVTLESSGTSTPIIEYIEFI